MNKLTIILFASFVTLIQIATALPMFEVPAHREPKKDTTPDGSDNDSKKSKHSLPDVPEPVVSEPVVPKPVIFEPVVPEPVVPEPVVPEPVIPKPIEPKPIEPKPIEPKPIEPKPVDNEDENSGGEVGIDDFIFGAIREHLGNTYDFDSMAEDTRQELYEMFCEMNIIQV